ncbi:hypothetical protein LJC64_02270 [Ruminococcaceae bacterium OttesenSCG-928-A11]|nr:hypothetical protein [Ruminococcaceae bacterium OttesenSCG-928-A11]
MAYGKVTILTALDRSGFRKDSNAMLKDSRGFSKSLGSNISQGAGVAGKALAGLGGLVTKVLSVAAIVAFGKASVQAARELSDAMTGLESIVTGQGRSFAQAQKFIDEYISDGLVPATNAITAYKNLALRGYDDSQIQKVLVALKDSAAYGRQASYTMGEAISSASEGLKNENSILVDNAGVTKNVAKMWDEYARSIGTTSNNLTQQQKIQAEVNGILAETRFQTGDAAKVAGTFSGQIMQLQFNFNNLKVAVGNAIIPIIRAILPAVNTAVTALTTLFNVFSRVTAAIFGTSAKEMKVLEAGNSGVADSAYEGADAEKALGGATKQAAKEAKGALAAFDDLNVLQQQTADSGGGGGGSGGGGGGSVETATVDTGDIEDAGVLPWLDKLKDKLAEITALFAPSINAWKTAFESLKAPIENAFNIMKGAALNLWENGLKPLGTYVLTDFIPSIVNGFSETFAPIWSAVMSVAITEFALDFEWMCGMVTRGINDMVIPALEGMKTWALDVFAGIKNAWDTYGAGILETWQMVREQIRAILTAIYENIILPIFNSIASTLSWLWDKHLKPLWDKLVLFFGAMVETVLAFWNNVLLPFINWVVATFGPLFSAVIGNIGAVFGTVFAVIADLIGGLLTSLRGVLEFLTGVFTGDWTRAWDGIKMIFQGVWDGIIGVIKGAINICIDCINGLVSGITGGVNMVIKAINSLNIDIPEWIPVVGGKSIGFNIPELTAPQIPKLAAGAVIPPNREFLAILGDQKSGTNIEAPLETIMEAMRMTLAEFGGGREVTIRFAGNLAELVRLLKPYIDKEESRVGGSLITGGVY